MKRSYEEIMEKVVVTDEMRARILIILSVALLTPFIIWGVLPRSNGRSGIKREIWDSWEVFVH